METAQHGSRKIGIVGTGQVGVAAAYAMFMQRVANELILVDKNRARAEGEAMDLGHGQAFVGKINVQAGDYDMLEGAEVVVVSAGVGQKPGETRLELLNRNARVFEEIARELDIHAPDAVVVVASNPVDVLTYAMQELSNRPRSKVIGTGTMLDTARFKALLGQCYGVSPRSVHAYILGEHGDTEFPAWSTATIGGLPLTTSTILGKGFDPGPMNALFVEVRDAAYRIIERKGYTNLAIGLVISHLVQNILDGQNAVVPLSVRLEGEYGLNGVCLSIPCVVDAGGLREKLHLSLDDTELEALRKSARVIGESIRDLSL